MKFKKIRRYPFKSIFAAMMTILTGNWASSALQGDVPFDKLFHWSGYPVVVILTTVGFFLLCSLSLYQCRLSFFPVKSLSTDEVTPHKCLIIPVSIPWPFNRENDICIVKENGLYKISVKNTKQGKWIDVPNNTIHEDINSLVGTGWSWQHMLRCIEPHENRLKNIYLIGSPSLVADGKKGSHEVLDVAKFLINHYLKDRHVEVQGYTEAVDFEDFVGMITVFNKVIDELKEKGFSSKDIIIDITGGQKPTSFAGAVVTLDKDVTFQYVQTNPDKSGKFKVLAYDLIIQSPTL